MRGFDLNHLAFVEGPSVSSPQPPGRSLPLGASPVVATNIRPPRFIGRCATVAYPGKRAGKDLVYMGKAGTGWSRTVSSQIRKQLDIVVSSPTDQKTQDDVG